MIRNAAGVMMADGPDPNPRPRDARRFDPFDPVLRTNPYPVYARFRRDAPIHAGAPPLSTLPECHYLFRYRDVDAAARDPRFGRARGLGYEGVGLKDAEPLRRDGRVRRRARKGAVELWEYLETVVAERRGRPGSDLISRLLAVEHNGQRLSDEEVLANCGLLLIAGHETTRNLIGNGTLALLQNRDQLRRLRANPDLLEAGIRELLRYDSSIQITFRVAAEDVKLGDTRIRQGQAVALVLGSANRDAEAFQDPDRLDLSRDSRRHLGFSAGSHYCLGAPLAVLEARMAIAALLERFGEIRPLMKGEPDWDGHVVFRGLRTLPIRVSGRLAVPSREARA
jgi:cytochrome P450